MRIEGDRLVSVGEPLGLSGIVAGVGFATTALGDLLIACHLTRSVSAEVRAFGGRRYAVDSSLGDSIAAAIDVVDVARRAQSTR